MSKKFKYELVQSNGTDAYRVSDIENDDRLATCFDEGNAVIVTELMNAASDALRMRKSLRMIAEMRGCECDNYHGHKCLMCRVRETARHGLGDRA